MELMRIFIGHDSREATAFYVCMRSLCSKASEVMPVTGLYLDQLQAQGIYHRPHERREGRIWDVISGAPMSTEFALTRFLAPYLAGSGWALFCDCDFLWRADVCELFALADPRYAVMAVKHDHQPREAVKMDGQAQLAYPRKNWSSLMLFNCDHPLNAALTPELVSSAPGRDLHGFCWLPDKAIGSLPETWNWLEGYSDPAIEPKAVHFTRGTPDMPGYEHAAYAEEWRAMTRGWGEHTRWQSAAPAGD